jgi:hypothetical protein
MRWRPGCCFRRAGRAANPLKHETWRTEPSATSYEDRTHWSNWLGADLLVGDDCLYASHQRNACANPRDAQRHLDRPSGLTTTASNQLGGSAGKPIELLPLAMAR